MSYETYYALKDTANIERVVLLPGQPVPMIICGKCWNILEDHKAYCKRCGYSGKIFGKILGNKSYNCHKHPSISAVGLCKYCSQPVCKSCCKVTPGGITMLYMDTYFCNDCSEDINRLELAARTFKREIYCFRHRNVKPKYKCKGCGEPTCEFCTYLPVKRIIKKRIVEETYCYSCMNIKLRKEYRHCILAYDRSLREPVMP